MHVNQVRFIVLPEIMLESTYSREFHELQDLVPKTYINFLADP